MKNASDKPKSWQLILMGGLVTALVVFWLWPRPKVQLSKQGYDITLALYRICNQRSPEELGEIEEQIDMMVSTNALTQSSFLPIAAIVDQAKSGQWRAASAACRQALEDQVSSTDR